MENKKTMIGVLVSLACMVGCHDKKTNEQRNNIMPTIVEESVVDTTVYGVCVDAAMHTVVLLTDQGDTIQYTLETADTVGDVQGGLFQGDRLAVIGQQVDGENFAQKVINLKSLAGKWASIDKNFEIKDGGVVESSVKAESKPYTSWRILNGRLVLSMDTFDVVNLGPDSLYLENEEGIFAYKRQKK